MKKVKNILVATDFSVTARNAFHYAKRLAKVLDATITVVHIKDSFSPDTTKIQDLPIKEHIPNNYDEEMELFVSEEDENDGWKMTKHKVKTLIVEGDPSERLVELSESNYADMIVLGTTGFADILASIIGTTSLGVANKAHCPVLLVPRDAKWKPIEKIMYASDYYSITPRMVTEITDFALEIKAKMHFVHVETNEPIDPKQESKDIIDALVTTVNPQLNYEIHAVHGLRPEDALQKYSDKHNINLMAFASKHRTFWERLMHHSVAEKMALNTNTPMMLIHTDDGTA